jgi:hypothetical protein
MLTVTAVDAGEIKTLLFKEISSVASERLSGSQTANLALMHKHNAIVEQLVEKGRCPASRCRRPPIGWDSTFGLKS